ncbi:SDR family oxidoreductase [soil metagenome]
MDLGLKNKVALVAGASKGLGYATALAFAKEGARVVICSRDADRINSAAATLHAETGAEILALTADVNQPADITHLIEQIITKFGSLHICVTNAGGPPSAPFMQIDDAQWQQACNQTLMSAVRMSRAVIPQMQKQQWGRIIHVASFSVKEPMVNLVLSNSIRSAVVALGKTQADELGADGILVNSVLPGWTATERSQALLKAHAEQQNISLEEMYDKKLTSIPLKRLGKPEEFAAAVVFLASERASFITGVALAVDGGQSRFPF